MVMWCSDSDFDDLKLKLKLKSFLAFDFDSIKMIIYHFYNKFSV